MVGAHTVHFGDDPTLYPISSPSSIQWRESILPPDSHRFASTPSVSQKHLQTLWLCLSCRACASVCQLSRSW